MLTTLKGVVNSGGSGQWTVDTGQWAGGSGQWTVGSGQWEVDSGKWTVGSGQWAMDSWQWTVGNGQWTVGSLIDIKLIEPFSCRFVYFVDRLFAS